MDLGEKYYGTVSYAPNSQACYVRVSISQPSGIPLCIKASFGPLGRHLLKKGAIVCVERTSYRDARRYVVAEVFGDRQKQTDKGDSAMSASTDRVRFFLPPRYFQTNCSLAGNGMHRETCITVLRRAFNLEGCESHDLMDRFPDGFTIVCRPSQFARFIVYRHEDGQCINGIKDLKPELVPKMDVYDRVALVTGVDRDAVKLVMVALEYGRGLPPRCVDSVVDVSGNFRGH